MPPPGFGTSLVAMFEGGADILTSGSNVTGWNDSSGYGQHLTTIPVGPDPYPQAGVDTIDGVPCVSFPIGNSADATCLKRAGFSLLDRHGSPLDFSKPRTVMAVIKPKYSVAAFGITGGPVFNFIEGPNFMGVFDLEDTVHTNGFYAWSSTWRDLTNTLRAPDVPGGAGGLYNGRPTLAEWRSSGNPNIAFAIDGTDKTLTPSTQYGSTSATPNSGFILGNTTDIGAGLNFLGAYAGFYVWDEVLSPTDHGLALLYLHGKFPSLALALPLAISPSDTTVAPNGRRNFVASGGTGPYTFSITVNRSGGSIDPLTGIYLAGPHGLVPDTIQVQDSLAATAHATVHVTVGLYQNQQRTMGPPSLKLPNGQLIESNYGAEKDIEFERERQGVLSAFPGMGAFGALDVIGRERQLPRATTETSDSGGANDQAYGERLRTAKTSWTPGGAFAPMLHALDRAGFPQGDPAGAHVIQSYRRIAWLTGAGGTPVYGTHPDPWIFSGDPLRMWNMFGILFGADVAGLSTGTALANQLNALVDVWRPRKARFMGTWVIVSTPTWGWPTTVTWGMGGRLWGGGVTRFVAPM